MRVRRALPSFGVLALVLAAATAEPCSRAIQAPPQKKGDCGWVRGRFVVANGSMVQRIWLIGTKRVVALPDDAMDQPSAIKAYERTVTRQSAPLFADFRICALEDSRPGWMRLVRVTDVRAARVAGKPFP